LSFQEIDHPLALSHYQQAAPLPFKQPSGNFPSAEYPSNQFQHLEPSWHDLHPSSQATHLSYSLDVPYPSSQAQHFCCLGSYFPAKQCSGALVSSSSFLQR